MTQTQNQQPKAVEFNPQTLFDRYQGKVAVVSGGSSGIGLAVSRTLAALGMRVQILDIQAPDENSFGPLASQLYFHQLDVRDARACHRTAQEIQRVFGRIYTLVNAAGIVRPDPSPGQQGLGEVMMNLFEVNAVGVANCCEAFFPFYEAAGGTVVNIGSIVGSLGWPGRASYCASKAAVHRLSESLALQYIQHGIRVNLVAPGIVATPLMKQVIAQSKNPQQAFRDRADLQSTGRLLTPEEVAETVLFLATDLSRGMVGATLDLSAGRLAGHWPQDLSGVGYKPQNSDAAWLAFSGT